MPTDPLQSLTEVIQRGLPGRPENGVKPLLEALFGGRYQKLKRDFEPTMLRDAYALGGDRQDGVPYGGLTHIESPPSGAYGGASIAWFPTADHGSLLTFVVGTLGLSPDEGILTRPGHRRRIAALRRYLANLGIEAWSKPDPSALGVPVPRITRDHFPGFESAFKRYGSEMYCIASVPRDERGRKVVQAFIDLYAYERGWEVLAAFKPEYDEYQSSLRQDLFPIVSGAEVNALLRGRRFVVLQGPPGTGKTWLAEQVRSDFFGGRGMTVQFHPAITYEDFVIGLSPDVKDKGLRFEVRRGWLLEAAEEAKSSPYLLLIDEVNRADLGKILGEAIYLFEPAEVGGDRPRRVRLPHAWNGDSFFSLPENLYVLATMNTADRSIAGMDLAVRRRFAFVNMPPDRSVIAGRGLALATEVFDRLSDVFVEHAPEEALNLLPGHAYFLAGDEAQLRNRFRFELLPLLDEYLQRGFLGQATTELHAVRNEISDLIK